VSRPHIDLQFLDRDIDKKVLRQQIDIQFFVTSFTAKETCYPTLNLQIAGCRELEGKRLLGERCFVGLGAFSWVTSMGSRDFSFNSLHLPKRCYFCKCKEFVILSKTGSSACLF
jgi:hypothetical protein